VSLLGVEAIPIIVKDIVDEVDPARKERKEKEGQAGGEEQRRLEDVPREDEADEDEEVLDPLTGPEGSEEEGEHARSGSARIRPRARTRPVFA
jgi:hypothetical protein